MRVWPPRATAHWPLDAWCYSRAFVVARLPPPLDASCTLPAFASRPPPPPAPSVLCNPPLPRSPPPSDPRSPTPPLAAPLPLSPPPSLPLTGADEVRGGANRFGDAVRSGWWDGGGRGWRQSAGTDGVVSSMCKRGGREDFGGGEGGRANYPACAGDAMWGIEGALNCSCGLIAGHLGVSGATGRVANREGIQLVPRADGGIVRCRRGRRLDALARGTELWRVRRRYRSTAE